MRNKICFIKINLLENKLLLFTENFFFLIFDVLSPKLEKFFKINPFLFKKKFDILCFFRNTVIFFFNDCKIFFFDYCAKKFYIAFKIKCGIFFSFEYYNNSIFFIFKKKNNLHSVNLKYFFHFSNSIYFKKVGTFNLKLSNKNFFNFFLEFKIRKVFGKTQFNFNSCFLFLNITKNFIICYDMSTKRIISEIIISNFNNNIFSIRNKKKNFKFFAQKSIKNQIFKKKINFIQNRKSNANILKYIIFNIFKLWNISKKKYQTYFFKNLKKFVNIWFSLSYLNLNHDLKCLGINMWFKKTDENFGNVNYNFSEIDYALFKKKRTV